MLGAILVNTLPGGSILCSFPKKQLKMGDGEIQ